MNGFPDCDFCKSLNSVGLRPFNGSFSASVSLAIYLGFDKIFLVGFDNLSENAYRGHWYEDAPAVASDRDDQYAKHQFLNAARQFAQIDIIEPMCSSTGESISYHSHTNIPLDSNVNVDIIEEPDLSALKTWPGFNSHHI